MSTPCHQWQREHTLSPITKGSLPYHQWRQRGRNLVRVVSPVWCACVPPAVLRGSRPTWTLARRLVSRLSTSVRCIQTLTSPCHWWQTHCLQTRARSGSSYLHTLKHEQKIVTKYFIFHDVHINVIFVLLYANTPIEKWDWLMSDFSSLR